MFKFVALYSVYIINILFRGWTLSVLWNMIIPRTFNLPSVAMLPAVGILLMFQLFTVETLPEYQEDGIDKVIMAVLINFVSTLVILVLGTIIAHNL